MKTIKNKQTEILESQVKFQGNKEKTVDYLDLMEVVLDFPPQGGYTPKDIRERNRIQEVIDKARKSAKPHDLELEDADYEKFSAMLETSRWNSRTKDLQGFLDTFN